jgi:hypothetical protein
MDNSAFVPSSLFEPCHASYLTYPDKFLKKYNKGGQSAPISSIVHIFIA